MPDTVLAETSVPLMTQRDRFEIPESVIYLNCASMAPQLRVVGQAAQDATRRNAAPWAIGSDEWFSQSERLRGLFAQVIGSDADGIAIVSSASYGIALAAANVPVRAGEEVIVMDREFPSNLYAWRELVRRRDARLRTVARSDGENWTEAVVAAISDRTAVVAVPNCHWTDGSLVDLVAVGDATRRVGAALVVDGSQSIGAVPIDLAAVRPDFLVTVGYKWLLGPYGVAYLYIAPKWRETGQPIEHSWLARAGSEDFARLTEYCDEFRHGARRFDMGGCPQFPLTPMAIAALEQIVAWRVDRIHASIAALIARLAEGLPSLAARSADDGPGAGHMMGIRVQRDIHGLAAALAGAGIYVGVRGDVVRVSPHVHNESRDIDRLIDAMRARLGSA